MVRERLMFVVAVVGVGTNSVTVLMFAMEFCAAPLRAMLEGRSEQVALGPGVMGVQLRTTVPMKPDCGVSWRV